MSLGPRARAPSGRHVQQSVNLGPVGGAAIARPFPSFRKFRTFACTLLSPFTAAAASEAASGDCGTLLHVMAQKGRLAHSPTPQSTSAASDQRACVLRSRSDCWCLADPACSRIRSDFHPHLNPHVRPATSSEHYVRDRVYQDPCIKLPLPQAPLPPRY